MHRKAPKNTDKNIWWRPALLLFFQMSGWIGIPVIIGLFVGRWLDDRYGTEPWLFLGTIGFAFIISIIGMVREAKRVMRDFDSPEGAKEAMKEFDTTSSKESIDKDGNTNNAQ